MIKTLKEGKYKMALAMAEQNLALRAEMLRDAVGALEEYKEALKGIIERVDEMIEGAQDQADAISEMYDEAAEQYERECARAECARLWR